MGDSAVAGKPVVFFDHHSRAVAEDGPNVYREIRDAGPIAWTDSHGGYWVVSGYHDVGIAARDDVTFSSRRDMEEGGQTGVMLPPDFPLPSGMLETDPPRNTDIRKKVISFFSPNAANDLLEVVEQYTSWCIDQFVEKGSCDLVTDLCGPIPAMLTLRLLGLPVTDWPFYSNAVHRGVCTPPEHPDRPQVDALGLEMFGRLWQATEQRRATPAEDLISYFATLEINGEQLPMAEAVGNVFLMLGGGVDTTTALLANTFLHLSENREARRYLGDDESRLHQACEEYLRYFAPVPGLSRTVTRQCELGGQQLQPGERVYLSWAAANLDPAEFGDADQIRLDRPANRHTAFGLGAHRCLGSHLARLIWRVVVREGLARMPELVVDRAESVKYTSVATVNGWETMPATFTSGPATGAPAPL